MTNAKVTLATSYNAATQQLLTVTTRSINIITAVLMSLVSSPIHRAHATENYDGPGTGPQSSDAILTISRTLQLPVDFDLF